jgi:hypothetical protein
MTTQSTIDRINDAIIALGQVKDLILRGNADRPNAQDVLGARCRTYAVAEALDAIGYEYDATEASIAKAVDDMGFEEAAVNADERLEQVRR